MSFKLVKRSDYKAIPRKRKDSKPFITIIKNGILYFNKKARENYDLNLSSKTYIRVFVDTEQKRIAFERQSKSSDETFNILKDGSLRIRRIIESLGFSKIEHYTGRYDIQRDEGSALIYIDLTKRHIKKPNKQ